MEQQKLRFSSKRASENSKHDVVQKVKLGRGDFVLIDARDRAAYDKAHIPGAISMTHEEVDARAAELRPDQEHVVYCWNAT